MGFIRGNINLSFGLFYCMAAERRKQDDPQYDDEMLKKLADRIRTLRKEKGYPNYEQFAYKHNISRAQFGRYEKGENLRFLSLLKVVDAFGMSLAEFFSEGFDK